MTGNASSWQAALVIALLALCGVLIALQATLNAQLSRFVGPAATAVAVHVIGLLAATVTIGLLFLVHAPRMAQSAGAIPWYAWLGGAFGVIIVGGVAFGLSRVGAGVGLAIVLSSQLIAGLVFDRFGWMGLTQMPITWEKAIGAVLLLVGAVLVVRQ